MLPRRQRISRELYEAIADAQVAAQRAYNLAHAQSASYWLRTDLGRAQSILISWEVRLAGDTDYHKKGSGQAKGGS